jgi:hypothetical protein
MLQVSIEQERLMSLLCRDCTINAKKKICTLEFK